MGGIYKVVLNGSYMGKDNQSILWYRTAVDVFGGLFGMGGAVELAEQVVNVIQAPWCKCKPAGYMFQSIDIYPHNDAFELAYQMPYRFGVEEVGTSSQFGTGTDGPAIAVNLRFNLEPVLLGPGRLYAPRNGYIAVGPIPSVFISDDGKLTGSFLTADLSAFENLKNAVSQNLVSVTPPAIFFPIRVTQKWGIVGDVMTLLGAGYADVQSATYDLYTTYRRSRRIKG